MPAAAVLTDEIKRKITQFYLEDKTAPAKVIRDKVHEYLGRTDWPKLSVIQREIKRCKDKDTEEFQEQERPWHLGLIRKYNISPEAGPYILGVQEWGEKVPDGFGQPHKPLTIRQALWVARLYPFVGTYLRSLDKKKLKRIAKDPGYFAAQYLWVWSEAYAELERLCDLSGAPEKFDTSSLDKGIRENAWPLVGWTDKEGNPLIELFGEDNTISSVILPKRKVKNERTHNQKRQR